MNVILDHSTRQLFFCPTPEPENLATLTSLAQQLSEKFQCHTATETELKLMGDELWRTLQLYPEVNATMPKRMVIDSEKVAVQKLPWECLHQPEIGFWGQQVEYTVARCMLIRDTATLQQLPKVRVGPLKILLFTAQPERNTQVPLEVEVEQQAVRDALEAWITQGWVHLYAPDDGRFATLVELLNSEEWQVVLLSGHTLFTSPPAQAFFVFENDDGTGDAVALPQLVKAFQNHQVQCVVMAACQSAQFKDSGETHFALSLAQAGIPHVIGMREPLVDRAGCIFVQAFCKALVQQIPVDLAVQQGRLAMLTLLKRNEVWQSNQNSQGATPVDPGVSQWSLPVLLTVAPDRPVIDWNFSPISRPPVLIGRNEGGQPLHSLALPFAKPFIGRRRELRTLGEALQRGNITGLLITGNSGVGKTALATQLVATLIEQGYRVLIYSSQTPRELDDPLSITAERWIIWWEGWERRGEVNIDKVAELERLSHYLSRNSHLRILLTSRVSVPFPRANVFSEYRLTRPDYSDFLRYVRHLGLPHPELQIRWIYEVLEGNFKGVQLLQSLPTCTQAQELKKQLVTVRRYLRAC